jgi:replicative DNA helicase
VSGEQDFPHSIEAEAVVLGSMLMTSGVIGDVAKTLTGADFYAPRHREVFDTMLRLYDSAAPTTSHAVSVDLQTRGAMERCGGAAYLADLRRQASPGAIGHYVSVVHDLAVKRRLIEFHTRGIQSVRAGAGADAPTLLDGTQSALDKVSGEQNSNEIISAEAALMPALDRIEELGRRNGALTGLPTGFADLDAMTSGLHPGQMVIVAARPAVGKCLTGDTAITDPRTGRTYRLDEFVARGKAGERLAVTTLTDEFRLVTAEPSDFIDNGVRPVFRLTTRSGRRIRATDNHPFLTTSGWTPLGDLTPGVAVAVPWLPDESGDEHRGQPADQVAWDEIVSITPDGSEQVYDLTVPGTHNFVAAGMIVHNSTLGLDIARNVAIKQGQPVLIFSLEMGRDEIMQRLLAAEARVHLQSIRSGKVDDNEWRLLGMKMGPISAAPLWIDDTANITMTEIRTKARRMQQRHGLALIVIDYLQLMRGDGRAESRQQEVSEISRSVKLLAKELGVPVIAMSQLNRGSETRTDKKPQVSDLRESGSLEQDADMIVLLYREDVHDPESTRAGEADLIIGKQRNGPTGVVTVAFQGHYSRFVDAARV